MIQTISEHHLLFSFDITRRSICISIVCIFKNVDYEFVKMSLCNCENNILPGIRQKPTRRFNSSLLELTAWNKRAMKVKWMGGERKNQFQPLNKTRKTKIWGFPDFWHVCLLAMRISKTQPLTQIGITELCEIVNVKWHWQLGEK